MARRPIYPGRRLNRFKYSFNQYQKELNVSDEGNTSEYSNPPSSKSSTLESQVDKTRVLCLSSKRPNDNSEGSSDSESEENMTIATQVCYDINKIESVV